jgi:small nuclear ribonucleoprotein B and B'
MKRTLGLVLLRGENIITMSAEAPPGHQPRKIGEGVALQPGMPNQIGKIAPINRGAPFPMGPPIG